MTQSQSVALFIDSETLWAVVTEAAALGSQPKFKTSCKHELAHVPGDSTRKIYFYTEALKAVFSKVEVKSGASVSLVMSDSEAFVRYFELPRIQGADLRAAVNFEGQKFMPFSMKELYFDFKAFPNAETKKQGIVFAAARKDAVEQWRQALLGAGFKADLVEPESLSFFRLMRENAPRESAGKIRIYAALRRGGSLTFIIGRDGEALMCSRAKIPPPMTVVGQEPKKIDSDAVSKQISLLLNYFSKNFRGLKAEGMVLTVDAGCAEEPLDAVLQTQLGFPVQKVSRASLWPGVPAEVSYSEIIALGALKANTKNSWGSRPDAPINIIASERVKKSLFGASPVGWTEEVAELKRLGLIEAAVLGVLLIVLHIYFLGQVQSSKKKLEQIRAKEAVSGLSAGILQAPNLEEASSQLGKKSFFLSTVYGKRVLWVPKLYTIAQSIPQELELDVLEVSQLAATAGYHPGTLRLEGRLSGEDLGPIDHFADSLKKSKEFSEGIGEVKISKLRKLADTNGNYTTTIFFIDSEQPGGGI